MQLFAKLPTNNKVLTKLSLKMTSILIHVVVESYKTLKRQQIYI